MVRTSLIAIACVVAATATPAVSADPTLVKYSLPAPVTAMTVADTGLLVQLSDGRSLALSLRAGAVDLAPAATSTPPKAGPNPLPDTVVATGTRGITAAWFIDPTSRYGHGVLGDAIEAGGIAARLADGGTAVLRLDAESVFEDRLPRLADLNGDGNDEILAVRSYLDRGAALSIVAPRGDGLAIVGEAAPIGRSNRWLNPIGVGDFDADGRIEAAVVITPHIGGTLTLYEWSGDKLTVEHEAFGFSNHAIGSRELTLAAVADMNGDGTPDIVLPDATRTALETVTFKGGDMRTLFEVPISGRLAGPVAAADLDGDGKPEIAFILAGNLLVVADPSP